MAKQNWQEVEFAQALGMATNIDNPGRKYAQLLLNVHTHDKPGKLTLRPGYALKYSAPSDSTIANSSFLNFEMFMDKQAVPAGQEITCLIQKGIIQGINNSGNPIVPDTQNALCFWIRPYWNGTIWVDNWQWLNRIIITNVTTGASPESYPNEIEVFGNATQGLGDNALIGWTIYNKTKNQYAKVITSKADGANTRICHTLYNSQWSTNDVIILMQNYYDLTCLAEIYNCAASDIVFHKVNDDLRIGFGGQANRTGIAIGYRQGYYLINDLGFSTIHTDLTAAGVVETFSTINQVILTPYIANPDGYGIDLTLLTGTLTAGIYYFRLTIMLDGYEEMLVADNSIKVDGTHDIQVNPWLILGKENIRNTEFFVYASTDGITYYQISDYLFTGDQYLSTAWQVNNNGQLYLNLTAAINSNPELYTNLDAANIADEQNSDVNWQVINPNEGGLLTVNTPGAGSSAYDLKFYYDEPIGQKDGVRIPLTGLRTKGKYTISIYFKTNITSKTIYVSLYCADLTAPLSGESITQTIAITNTFTQYIMQFDTSALNDAAAYLVIEHIQGALDRSEDFEYDLISVKANEVVNYTPLISAQNVNEMSDIMGYTPDATLMTAWDQALVFHGRTYFLNPYVGGRLDGFIYVSIINAPNSFLWDIATADNYRELDTFESYEVIGMILLPTMELLILMNNCITAIDPDTGIARNPIFNVGVISRDSIVNINGIIFWCDDEDIYMLNIGDGLNPKPLLENTIRDLYQALARKNLLFCVRDKYNTYRVRTYDPVNKTEYLLSKNGWIEEQKFNYPEIYRVSANKKLNFLSQGNTYEMETEFISTIPVDDTGQAVSDGTGQVAGT
ncbi:MAG: hypothetical protein ABR980_09440 [Ignavibacteriaceae bacterium]